ncbi:uncharacterized protein LOC128549570 isoform X2 [Mercenaria mercenaria]|uniref:uncharacterized protein LOC128549570 isoform X2 n=1 Tax=Mercenaria mercenaria TaxID=6596 RepID=UPI00234EC1D6|nr:uncharacterized protein LOC128549570 isoform X2 [Mercenaria mercenaria]
MGAKISKFVIPDSCYPSYQYTKRHAATIIDDYTEVRLRILQNQKPVIDKETRTDITLRVSEPLDKKLLLHPADFVLRASKKCRIHVENIGKTFALLYSSYFANSTVIAIERFGVEENEPVPLFLLLAEDKEDMAGFENRVLKNMQVCLKENVNVKICEMLERDIILQMKKVYEDLEKVQCYIENQQKTANHQKTIGIPCSCSNEKGSCKCYGSIIEEIKRLQADITGLVKRSKVPEDQKPQLNTDIEIEVDRKVIDAFLKTSQSIDHCGYNLDTLYIFVSEKYPSEKLKANIEKTMTELCIKNFRIVSSHVDDYSNPASGSGVVVKTMKGNETISLSGTLAGFGRLERNESLVAIMSRHLAKCSMDRRLYIQNEHGLNCVTGDIMNQLFQNPKAVRNILRDENGDSADTALVPAGTSNEDENQKIYVDMAFAYIDNNDEPVCDTMYRTDKGKPVAGRPCALDPKKLFRLPVYIWGHATGLGHGIIAMSKTFPVNDSGNHLLMIEDKKGNTFCKEGDSGAMVCADDPDNYGDKVQLVSIVMGAVVGEKGKYQTVKIREGLEYIADEIGENISMC